MKKVISKKELKQVIFEAFKDVPKGNGLGARECKALDDYAGEEGVAKARAQDTEKHWWEYPKELFEKSTLDYCLNYNNKDGVKFHLPWVMTIALDGYDLPAITVYAKLCGFTALQEHAPDHGRKEFLDYLRRIKVKDIVANYAFTPEQVRAIALYFSHKDTKCGWSMLDEYHYMDWESAVSSTKDRHEHIKQQLQKTGAEKNYTLTLDEAITIAKEEKRIVEEWFKAGEIKKSF